MGCSSHLNGNVGVVHLISEDSELQWLLDQGPNGPYVAMITPQMFTRSTLSGLKSSGKINGALLLAANDSSELLKPPSKYSDDVQNPSAESSLYAKEQIWNPWGSGILMEDWPFPIFLIKDHDKVQFLIKDCFEKFNQPDDQGQARSWPLCSVELKSHMLASVDTKTCQRRNNLINPFSPVLICDPMGDQNIFHLNPQNVDWSSSRYADSSIILVSAKLDAVNLFDKLETGLDSPTVGIVTLLAAAELLYRDQDFTVDPGKNVLLAFLNGESFDYIGSSRLVYDMKNGKFPREKQATDDDQDSQTWPLIDLKSIKMHLELGQLVNYDQESKLYAHVDTQFKATEALDQLVQEASRSGLSLEKLAASNLPPASIQSLLKEDRSIPGILLTNFKDQYRNPHFHSLYDNITSIGMPSLIDHLSSVSETLARFISAQVAGNDQRQDWKANKTLIGALLDCYSKTAQCEMFHAVTSTDFVSRSQLIDRPLPQYVGVERSQTFHTLFTHRLLAYLTSKPLEGNFSVADCKTAEKQFIYNSIYVSGQVSPSWWNGTKEECEASDLCGYCLNSTAFLSKAVSPGNALNFDDF